MSRVALRATTAENREAVVALRVAPSQKAFIPEVEESLNEARDTPEGNPWYRAMYADDQPVGFVRLSWNVSPDPPRIIGSWFLWRLLIDERHQRRGHGREAVRLVADVARDHGASELLTSHALGVGSPAPFYRQVRFVPTGAHDESGEVILALNVRR